MVDRRSEGAALPLQSPLTPPQPQSALSSWPLRASLERTDGWTGVEGYRLRAASPTAEKFLRANLRLSIRDWEGAGTSRAPDSPSARTKPIPSIHLVVSSGSHTQAVGSFLRQSCRELCGRFPQQQDVACGAPTVPLSRGGVYGKEIRRGQSIVTHPAQAPRKPVGRFSSACICRPKKIIGPDIPGAWDSGNVKKAELASLVWADYEWCPARCVSVRRGLEIQVTTEHDSRSRT